MGFIRYKSHAVVVSNEEEPDKDRMWAFRSCCFSVCSLVEVIEVDELTRAIADLVSAEVEELNGRFLLASRFTEAGRVLTSFRVKLVAEKRRYDAMRRTMKRRGTNFPVQPPFEKATVLKVLDTVREEHERQN